MTHSAAANATMLAPVRIALGSAASGNDVSATDVYRLLLPVTIGIPGILLMAATALLLVPAWMGLQIQQTKCVNDQGKAR